MDKGTRDGSVMKRKRKRETARRVLDILEEKAQQQMQCSEQLQHTMKGIYYRLTTIQKLMENVSGGNDISIATSLRDEQFQKSSPDNHNGQKDSGQGTSREADAGPCITMPSTTVYNVTVQRGLSNIPTLQYFGDSALKVTASEKGELNVPFQQMAYPSKEVPLLMRDHLQEADVGGDMPASPSSEPSLPGVATAEDNPQRPQTAPKCLCDSLGKDCINKRRPGTEHRSASSDQLKSASAKDAPAQSIGTIAQKHPGGGEPQEFSDKDLENVFEEEEIPDVQLDPNERVFMKEYPELDQNFEPKREYPLPYTPGQNYPGGWNPPEFTPEELEKAFEVEEVPDVDLQPNEKLFMTEFKDLAGDWTPTAQEAPKTKSPTGELPTSSTNITPQNESPQQPPTSSTNITPQNESPQPPPTSSTNITPQNESPQPPPTSGCPCGGSRVIRRVCPLKKNVEQDREHQIGDSGAQGPAEHDQPPEQVAQQETTAHVASAPSLAHKPPSGGGEPQEFSDKDLEHVFEEEEIPDVQLDPNERVFMKEYPELDQNFEPKREYPLPYTPGQNYPGGWNPPEFTPEELEKAFEVEEVPDVDLQPNERLFMTEFKDLAGDWTPSSAHAVDQRPAGPTASAIPSEAPSATHPGAPSEAPPGAPSEAPPGAPSEAPPGAQEGASSGALPDSSPKPPSGDKCCACGRVKRRSKENALQGPSDTLQKPSAASGQPSGISKPLSAEQIKSDTPKIDSAVTVTQKPTTGAGEPQEFSDKDLEHVFEEEEIPDVQLDPNERVFMKEYPELDQNFEPKREYPLPYTPGQNYPGGWNPPEFTPEELEKAFEVEEVPDADLQPNERLFMTEFKDLAGDWTPTNAEVTVRNMQTPPSTHSGPTPPHETSTATAGQPTKKGERCCICGKALGRIPAGNQQVQAKSPQASQMSSAQPGGDDSVKQPSAVQGQPAGSGVTVAQKATGSGDPQEFSDKDLEHVFEEEEIPDVKLDPNEKMFMTEYPELNQNFEPTREYPLPYTPGQNYPGGWNPPEFSPEELEKAFEVEEVPDADLQPNEKLFMTEFKDLAGDWSPTSSPALAQPFGKSIETIPSSPSKGPHPPPTGFEVCCKCGKLRRLK